MFFVLVFLFCKFSLTSIIFINNDGCDNYVIYIFNQSFSDYLEDLCLSINLLQVLYSREIRSWVCIPIFPEINLLSQAFINIHEYTNEIICIWDSPEKIM